MGRKTEIARGKRNQFLIRAGSQYVPEGFGGMWTEGDPGANPFHRPRHLENVRFQGPGFVCKPGMSAVNVSPLQSASACITSLEDYQVKPRRIYFSFAGCPGLSPTVGFTLAWFDTEQDPALQRGVRFSTALSALTVGPFSGALLAGVDSTLRKLEVIVLPYSEGESLTVGGESQANIIERFTIAYGHPADYTVGPIETFNGSAYFGLTNGGASRLGSYNGTRVRNDVITGITPVTGMGRWRDVLVIGHNGTPNLVRFLKVDGTTYTAAPGAGTAAYVHGVSYKDDFYFTDGGTNVWKISGTTSAPTVAIINTVATSTMQGIAVHNGYLYYGYLLASGVGRIGRYDGTSWVDNHKDLTAQASDVRQPVSLVSYRGSLVVSVNTLASGGRIYVSPGNSTSGTYVAYNAALIQNGAIFDSVVV